MKTPTSTQVRIVDQKGPSGLSKAQKQFNTLIKRIEKERKRLAEWQETVPLYQQRYASELDPLLQSYEASRIEMVRLLDRAWSDKALTKNERAKLSDLICGLVVELAGSQEDLKPLYNKHSGGDFDREQEEENAAVKSMMEEMFGIELGDDIDFSSPEAMMRHVAEKFQQQGGPEAPASQPKARKSAKALEREARQEQEAQNVSQSIREVFRKLASALHPDKEQDRIERERKTALMQRVNVAYGNNDLLGLLKLQLEVEQIDQDAINNVGEDRLKHYNKVLREQCAEIEQEVAAIEFSLQLRFKLEPERRLSPLTAMRGLERSIVRARLDIASINSDLASFQDMKNIKRALKAYRIRVAQDMDWL